MKLCLFITALLVASCVHAQQDTTHPMRTIFVVRPGQYVGALAKIRVDINGKILSMANASYAMLQLRVDSVVVQIDNRRVSGESVQPLVSYKDTSYYVVFPEEHAHKRNRLIVTEVEHDAYDKYAAKITRQINPEP
jgi:hypothetical protein